MNTNNPETYGLIGRHLGHSFSRGFFTEKFTKENINARYLNFELADISELPGVIRSHDTLRGFNVTVPYKRDIIPFLDAVDKDAAEIGAVNVVRVERDDERTRLVGFNSDIVGFAKSLRPLLTSEHRKALVLGTGGASLAVVAALRKLGIVPQLVSRTSRKGVLGYVDIDSSIMASHQVVVNCTPLGMWPNVDTCPEIPYNALDSRHLCFDLTYNPEKTLFLQKAEQQGAVIKNGLEMLHLQAIESWRIWNIFQ